MGSASSRGQIVLDALALAGRSTELKQSCNQWLNYFLRHVGLTFRFPELRKVGTPITLPQGQQIVSLPADLGAGMDKFGMIFGPDAKPLGEVSFEEFATGSGFLPVNGTTGRPTSYIVDLESGNFRFNRVADQPYSFTPVYFKTPPLLAVDSSGDNSSVWIDNDFIAVQGLVWVIYQFKRDPRETEQADHVFKLLSSWQREVVKMGGSPRIMPSPSRFKTVKFGGFNGP